MQYYAMIRTIMLGLMTLVASVCVAKPKAYTNLYEKVPHSGYVGSVALDISAPGAYGSTGFGVTTTHGLMVRPTVFAGLGTGYLHSFNYGKGVIPVFAEGRFYFPSQYMRRIYPHVGVRLGGQIGTEGGAGFYSQVACGIRIPFSDRIALNVEVGPQYAGKYERASAGMITYNGKYKAKGQQFGFFGRISLEF